MADPTVHIRRALANLQQRTAMRAEIVMLRRELAIAREDLAVQRLLLALAPYRVSSSAALPPLRLRHATIPRPRVTPEGIRHARATRRARSR